MPSRYAPLLQYLHRLASPRVASTAPDAELLHRFVRQHDEAAFAALVTRHGPLVLRVCGQVLQDAQAAEDCLQAVFLVLARRAGSLRRPEALAGWLHGVALRVACKARVAARRVPGMPSHLPEPLDPRPGPLDALTARELLEVLHEEVARLPERYRLPLILCHLEGRTVEEAASQLGWTPGSVKGRLERGRKRLHARLVRRGVGTSGGPAGLGGGQKGGAGGGGAGGRGGRVG